MVEQKINILLVEDDFDIAAGIGDYLQGFAIYVDFAYSVQQALSLVDSLPFDLLILDINLPDGDGISLCRKLKQEKALSAPVIFLTAKGELQDKLLGFESGAVDYMVKPFALAELKARINAALLHRTNTESVLLKAGNLALDFNKALLSRDDKQLQLYATGNIIMRELLSSYPKPVSKQRLYNMIWSDDIPKSDPLRAHVHQLRQFFQAEFGCELIETIRGVGYKLELS
jgi:DNA-binding response OmpR family regulator